VELRHRRRQPTAEGEAPEADDQNDQDDQDELADDEDRAASGAEG
jgi:hypothetical protein